MIQGQIALKRKEFVQKEAHLYFNAYREISDEVKYFCEQRGIALVLNFNGDNIHEENPEDVARGISNKVVYYNRNLDITRVYPAAVRAAACRRGRQQESHGPPAANGYQQR